MRSFAVPLSGACILLLAACQPEPAATERAVGAAAADSPVPGDASETAPYSEIAADEVLRSTSRQALSGRLFACTRLIYTTQDYEEGTEIEVERFAGRGGIAFSGTLEGAAFEMMVTSLACSDGMSDRTYPFTVTLGIGEDKRNGCAWSEQHPFDGPEHP